MVRQYLTELDLTVDETRSVLDEAHRMKTDRMGSRVLDGRHVALYFEKPSVRTRTSFTVGVHELGGHVVELSGANTKLGKGETLRDFASVISRYVHVLVARVFSQSDLEGMAGYASIPVINALSDDRHPCQALADVMTIEEKKGRIEGVRMTFVGDGNNVAASTGLLAAALGAEVTVASPEGYGLSPWVLEEAKALAGSVVQTVDPDEAVDGADVVYTDTWISMGQESETARRRDAFGPYCVNGALLLRAETEAVVMHCLPAVPGEEIDQDVMYGSQSAIWQQAENRLHAQKALLAFLIAGS